MHPLLQELQNNYDQCDLSPEVSEIFSTYHLRFELGGGLQNGTIDRVNHSVSRAVTIFEDFFELEDNILILIKDYKPRRDMSKNWSYTPNYLEDQILNYHNIEKSENQKFIEDFHEAYNENDQLEMVDFSATYIQTFFTDKLRFINYKNLIRSIANKEMGFNPQISEDIYFFNPRNNICFYMYDDRGCLVFGNSKQALQSTYIKFNKWLVDYHRETFDELFS